MMYLPKEVDKCVMKPKKKKIYIKEKICNPFSSYRYFLYNAAYMNIYTMSIHSRLATFVHEMLEKCLWIQRSFMSSVHCFTIHLKNVHMLNYSIQKQTLKFFNEFVSSISMVMVMMITMKHFLVDNIDFFLWQGPFISEKQLTN